MAKSKKFTISNDLMARVKQAAANGSVVANDLVTAIKAHKDKAQETDKTVDYFDSVRRVSNIGEYKTVRIEVSCCRKDLTNKNFPDYGNPNAPYFPENRNRISVKDFAECFKAVREKEYTDTEWQYFDGAMRIGSKVTLRVGTKVDDFVKAYTASNYVNIAESVQSTLHGSCMRHEETARNAADFYANFAGCKILIAETEDGSVCARALLWDNIIVPNVRESMSFIDRTYTAFDSFLLPMMYAKAKELGYEYRKKYNDYSHKTYFTSLDDGHCEEWYVCIDVPQHRWHKTGAPYVDTMSYVMYNPNKMAFRLANRSIFCDGYSHVATATSTGGYASLEYRICPVRGKVHCDGQDTCDECNAKLYEDTFLGRVLACKTTKYKGMTVPAMLVKKGKPTPEFAAFIALQKLTTSRSF